MTIEPNLAPRVISLRAALLLTTLSGVAYGLSFPPLAARPLAWVALVPWLVAAQGGTWKRAILLGALWAHVETFVTSDCLPDAVVAYYGQTPLVGWGLLEGATLVTMVPWYAAFSATFWLLARSHRGLLPLLTAAAWVAAEQLRVTALGGNPWAISGYSQVGFLPLMQVADLAGVHGMSFVVAAVNAGLAGLIIAGRDRPDRRRAARVGLASAVSALALAVGYGTFRLASPLDPEMGRVARIAIVQGNLPLGSQWQEDMYGRNLEAYLGLTREAVGEAKPGLVFWPENAMTFFLADEPAYRAALAHELSDLQVQLVAGGPRVEWNAPSSGPEYFNATFLIAPTGDVLGWQDKRELLPFAEYFPFQSIGLLRRDFGRARQFSPGLLRPPLSASIGEIGSIVCNEAMFPLPAAAQVAQGAEILVNPANDSWFASLKYSRQAFDIARLRAIEQRRYLVRASTAGPSGIVDPWGRITASSTPFAQEWITGEIRPSRAKTIYARIGDVFGWACSGVVAIVLGWRLRCRLRDRSTSRGDAPPLSSAPPPASAPRP